VEDIFQLRGYEMETLDLITQDVYKNLTSWTFDEMNGFHNSTNHTMVTDVAGLYKLSYSISSNGGGALNHEYSYIVAVNGIEQENVHAHSNSGTAQNIGSVSGTGLIRLAINDRLNFWIKDEDNPVQDIDVSSANLNLLRVGD